MSIAGISHSSLAAHETWLTAAHPAAPGPMHENIASPENIWAFGGVAVMLSFVAIALLYLISCRLLRWRARGLKWLFVVAWVMAFAVYDVGMYTGQYVSLLANAPMAVIHAFETFLLGSDVSAIHEPFHNSWVFMGCFSFSHALSAFVSTLFLIKVFGFNIKQKWKLFKESMPHAAPKSETFVFWGTNRATYRLVESIRRHYASDRNACRIIVVKTPDEPGGYREPAGGINGVFGIISFDDPELRQLQELDCLTVNSSGALLGGAQQGESDALGAARDILGGRLHLRSLVRILSRKTQDKIHFLLLSDNEKNNLHDVEVLLTDSTLNAFAGKKGGKVIFYCHARYNGVHRVIEDQHRSCNMEVRVIDSSHINVELLKEDAAVLPVNFVDVEADGTVSSPFNAMVVGFSEVGQDAVRFLYEFGAFVRPGGDRNSAWRSDFHLDVVDNRMRDKAGAFVANAPAIAVAMTSGPGCVDAGALIGLHDLDCRSVEFYRMLEDKIPSLNYIVIATENDELNMTMGVRIFRAATRYRRNLDKLCILIRIHDDSDGHFAGIAGYYNSLWDAQEAAGSRGRKPSAEQDGAPSGHLPLHIFGLDEEVYTYDNIIDGSVIRRAMDFKERYVASTDPDYTVPGKEADYAWHRDVRALEEGGMTYSSLMRIRRWRGQDVSNSLHWRTKELLSARALARCGIVEFPWASLRRPDSQTLYYNPDGSEADRRIARLLTVLAQTEHLRWNASHEILGYVYGAEGKDEVRLHHDCLTDWGHLSESVRSYDHNVVDITLGILAPCNKTHPMKS